MWRIIEVGGLQTDMKWMPAEHEGHYGFIPWTLRQSAYTTKKGEKKELDSSEFGEHYTAMMYAGAVEYLIAERAALAQADAGVVRREMQDRLAEAQKVTEHAEAVDKRLRQSAKVDAQHHKGRRATGQFVLDQPSTSTAPPDGVVRRIGAGCVRAEEPRSGTEAPIKRMLTARPANSGDTLHVYLHGNFARTTGGRLSRAKHAKGESEDVAFAESRIQRRSPPHHHRLSQRVNKERQKSARLWEPLERHRVELRAGVEVSGRVGDRAREVRQDPGAVAQAGLGSAARQCAARSGQRRSASALPAPRAGNAGRI